MFLPLLALALGSRLQLPTLHVDGPDLKDPAGHVVSLRGCNLGGWFMIEHWMWDQAQGPKSSHDQFELEEILSKRFGEAEKDRLMDLYRSSWITDRDLDIVRSFRFNCVRLPLNYRMFEDDAEPFHLRDGGWKWTDKAVAMCARHGLYVVLDLHGVQGGQSKEDHTGRANQNKIWTNQEDQQRFAWLWQQMAKRYRSNPAVVAYDVINEPYGGQKAEIRAVWEKAYKAIRSVDPEKLVYAMGHYSGFDMYGNPHANGWHNVGIEMHYYPGLFGNGSPTVSTNMRHLSSVKNTLAPEVAKLKVPFYVGEFNVVFNSAGNPEMMRRTFDTYESLGWAATMWSYKTLSKKGGLGADNWGMVTNRDPIPAVDFATAPESAIEDFFRSQATLSYSIFEGLRDVMAPLNPKLAPVVEERVRTKAPQGELAGWTNTDVGQPLAGGFEGDSNNFMLYGGGEDIWAERDQFRFLHQEVSGNFELTVQVNKLEDLGPYCKAGLMVRGGLANNAPFILISTFPTGQVQTAVRVSAGASVQGAEATDVGFPMQLRISRHGGVWSCAFRHVGAEQWVTKSIPAVPGLGDRVSCGPISLSHDGNQLVQADYGHLELVHR